MTPHRIEFWGGLALAFILFLLCCRFWPVDESDTSLRQKAADVLGLIRGLTDLACWVLLKLPRLLLGSRREVTR